MAKTKKPFLSDSTKRIITLALGGICSSLILVFSVLTIATISKGDYKRAPDFLVWVFVSMGLASILVFLQNRNKYNLMRTIILLTCNIALGIAVLFAKKDIYIFSLTAGLYCVIIIITRVIRIIEKKSIRALVFNIIFKFVNFNFIILREQIDCIFCSVNKFFRCFCNYKYS